MRNLSSAVKKSVNEAQIETNNKTFNIEKKINKFDMADNILIQKQNDTEEESPIKPVQKVKKDSFCFPEEDYELIQIIRDRVLKKGKHITKSETLRIGLRLMNELSDNALIEASHKIQKLKLGRK